MEEFAGWSSDRKFGLRVPSTKLSAVIRACQKAEGRETGGILIGHLRRDASGPEAFVEVTAQIHARDAKGTSDRLTFTPEAWTSVASALELRARDEIMVGWWHSHPIHEWCKDCSHESRRTCPMARDFFSAHDRALHRTVFPRAYSVALVVNDTGDGRLTLSAFGWRDGQIQVRGFRRLVSGEAFDAA